MIRQLIMATVLCVTGTVATTAAPTVQESDLLKHEQPNVTMFVFELYDPTTQALVSRKAEPLARPIEIRSDGSAVRVINGKVLQSYGLNICPEKRVFYGGQIESCKAAVAHSLRSDPYSVILCRALNTPDDPLDADCYRILREKLPDGSPVLGVISDDKNLVFGGFATVKDEKGIPMRPELLEWQSLSKQQRMGMYGLINP